MVPDDLVSAETTILEDWAAERSGFVRDGVVDAVRYVEAHPRLLFVLKEVNDEGGGGWDLREFLRHGGQSSTWNNITRWVEGIRSLPRLMPWHELSSVSEDKRRQVLRSIVAVNVKKTPGAAVANEDEVRAAAVADRKYLTKQLRLYEAELMICCGTGDIVAETLGLGSPESWPFTSRGVHYQRAPFGTTVVSYSHPGARVASYILHYGLVDSIAEILRDTTVTNAG